ncbi:hypothetical protein VTJ49DRAFT_7067 [Mycothermus thermophilus]|uniref:Splicing factor YJU2 n=1 Tax=Humicola insolens TaxID=85995 RepID=A0ABR3VHZ4_HUMIN
MKFAKELEKEAVPEWRVKYLNYKQGKKHIKAVARAISRANSTPTLARRPSGTTPAAYFGIDHDFTPPLGRTTTAPEGTSFLNGATSAGQSARPVSADERSELSQSPGSGVRYGSIAASDQNTFELPGPAIRVPSNTGGPASFFTLPRSATVVPSARVDHRRNASTATGPGMTPRMRLNRLFTGGSITRQQSKPGGAEIGMQALDYVRATERDFFTFLDSELDKIETFYREKEVQATERLAALSAQLREMRNRRTYEIAEAKRRRKQGRSRSRSDDDSVAYAKDSSGRDWLSPLRDRFIKPGPNSKALQKMTRTPVLAGQRDQRSDYVRRPTDNDVPYRTAKRKLKLALQEFYRSLELLKSYALLNRTAFRKLNKKYDKAVNARPPYRYMNEKVNKSWFVNSDALDAHIRTVEDLYARYFEKGNHKIAAGKLRGLQRRPGDTSGSTFRSGLMIGIGVVFAIQGLVHGADFLFDDDYEDILERTSYLLQLYGGYFLMLLLFSLFTLACYLWTKHKVNYPFIFEFDARHVLDWRQLAEFPSFFFALFGVFIWLNFSKVGSYWEDLYLYYPVLLVGISIVILFLPLPILHHRARRWFVHSHFRLLLSGLYPVEFRDFFLGDIWCSLTYATCNIELFFCLYANSWNNPEQCNSSHSRLLGFFSALPPIWRALQCIRRYYDTRNWFPHLANCGKYTMTIITAVWLSLYRIGDSHTNLSLFITFATINAVYCSVWDIFMDFALLQPNARKKFLRNITALRPVWIYYAIMVIDPILRFSWVFYAIFTHNTQHSTLVTFFVAMAEVVRRGLWTIFRVENEHCGNVANYKAARDTPLPYHLELFVQRPSLEEATAAVPTTDGARAASEGEATATSRPTSAATLPSPSRPATAATSVAATMPTPPPGTTLPPPRRQSTAHRPSPSAATAPVPQQAVDESAIEEGMAGTPPTRGMSLRRRMTDVVTESKRSIRQAMAQAHRQDFEKRRRGPEEVGAVQGAGGGYEDEEEEEDEDVLEEVKSDDEEEGDSQGMEERLRRGERKYYPPDFDPSLVGRSRKPKRDPNAAKVQTVRLMLPFSLRCVTCGEYMYRGRKFNARKETPPGETYLGIQLYRFYIRCTRCSGEIVFRTDPKNQDYLVERGAKRNTDPWKRGLDDPTAEETDEQRLDRLEREMAEAEGEAERNAMAELEAKTEDAKREMMVADMLDEIRSRNARLDKARQEAGGDVLAGSVVVRPEEEERRRQEEEDAEAARRAFAFARRQDALEEVIEEEEAVDGTDGTTNGGPSGSGSGSASVSVTASASSSKPPSTAPTPDVMPPPSFKRQVKKKKDHSAALGIKIKKPLV